MTTDQTALVLLVDDDEDLLLQHELVLKKAGYAYVTLDLAGIRSGSLLEVLPKQDRT